MIDTPPGYRPADLLVAQGRARCQPTRDGQRCEQVRWRAAECRYRGRAGARL